MAVVVAHAQRRAQQKLWDRNESMIVEKLMPAPDRCLLEDLLRRKQGRYYVLRHYCGIPYGLDPLVRFVSMH